MKISPCLKATPSRSRVSSRSLSSAVFYYYLLPVYYLPQVFISFFHIIFVCNVFTISLTLNDISLIFNKAKNNITEWSSSGAAKIQYLKVKRRRDLSQAAFIWLIVSYHRSMNEGIAARKRERKMSRFVCSEVHFAYHFLTVTTTFTHSLARTKIAWQHLIICRLNAIMWGAQKWFFEKILLPCDSHFGGSFVI